MAIDWEKEINCWINLEVGNALFSHFGYVAVAVAASLFKLTIAAALVSYSAFLCATLVGGFVTYFPARAVKSALESSGLLTRISSGMIGAALHLGLSPVVGAYILNFGLGWSLPLMPLLVVGGVSLAIGIALVVTMVACGCCANDHSNQLSSACKGYRANALLAAPRAETNDAPPEFEQTPLFNKFAC